MAEITSLDVVSVLCYNHKVLMVLSLDARIYLKGFSALNKERHKGRKFQTHTHCGCGTSQLICYRPIN